MANSWRHERWDSLRLLTPNWQNRLPGLPYEGPDPGGYMTAGEVTELIERFARISRAPVRTGTNVTSVRRAGDGYRVTTTRGEIGCRAVVIASGACNRPSVPPFGAAVPASVEQLHAVRLSRPGQAPRRRRARRRRVGDRRAAGRRAAAVGPAGDPRSGSMSGCRGPTAGATCCGGWTRQGCGTSGTTRSTTSRGPGGCPRRSSPGPRSGRRSISTRSPRWAWNWWAAGPPSGTAARCSPAACATCSRSRPQAGPAAGHLRRVGQDARE